MTVYAVVYGFNGCLEGVFSTEEKAIAAVSKLEHPKDFEIWETVVDEEIE